MSISTPQRIDYIDLAKGVCILLVVFHHMASYYNWGYLLRVPMQSFRMPLYFLLLGLFFKEYRGFFDFLKRKVNRLLIPFLFFFLFTSIPITMIVHQRSLWDVLIAFSISWDFENVCVWFLLSLFEINIIYYVIFMMFNKHQWLLLLSVMVLGVLGLILSPYEIKYRCFLDTSFVALPFFYFEFILYRHTNFLYYETKLWQDVLFILFSIFFLLIFSHQQDFGLNVYSNYFTVYPCGIIGTMMVFVIAKRLKRLPLLSYLERYSIIVLCTHLIVMKILRYVMRYIIIDETYTMWINFVLTVFSMLIIIPLCRKYIPYFTAQKDLIPIS